MLYAVVAVGVRLGDYVPSALTVLYAVPCPTVEIAGTDRYAVLRTGQLALGGDDIDAVAAVNGGVTDSVGLAVSGELMASVRAGEGVERDTLAEKVCRVHRQVQYVKRVNSIRAAYFDRIYIRAGVVIPFVAPFECVALADLFVPGAHLHLFGGLFHAYADAVDAVAAGGGGVRIGVIALVSDDLTAPVQRLTRYDRCRVVAVERLAFLQNGRDDGVAS